MKEMTSQELSEKMIELKNELFNLRFQLATGQLDNPLKIKAIKKDIARVNTILRQKEIQA
jgi:large subunit ribosomal protein L29